MDMVWVELCPVLAKPAGLHVLFLCCRSHPAGIPQSLTTVVAPFAIGCQDVVNKESIFPPSLNSQWALNHPFSLFQHPSEAAVLNTSPPKHFLFHHTWLKGQPHASCRQPTASAAKSPVPQSLSPPQDGFTPPNRGTGTLLIN